MSQDEIKAWTDFLLALNSAKWWVLVAIMLSAMGGALSFFYYLHVRRKEAREIEVSKEKRAKAYGLTFNGLKDAIESQRATQDKRAKQQSESLDALNSGILALTRIIQSLAFKIDGRMSRKDSARFIHHAFERDLHREVCMVVEASLTENDYANRKEFIARKIKTAIGEAMVEVRDYLCSYPLAINPNDYFLIDPDSSGERFVLCDAIWATIERQFHHTSPLAHRIEESYLLIENTVKDYLTGVYTDIMEVESEAKYRRNNRTPVPGESDGALVSVGDTTFSMPGASTASLMKRRNNTMSSGG